MEKLSLIEGNFCADEASEILRNVFSAKISFHENKNFSSQERFGKHDETAQRRIPELKNSMNKLLKIVAEAKSGKKKLKITSEINISISDE
ncbi:MAG: hypothetical protein ABIQ40_08245 [Bacteroidia bacterium]